MHLEHHHACGFAAAVEQSFELVDRAEKEGTEKSPGLGACTVGQGRDVGRQPDRFDPRQSRNAMDEKKACQHQPDFDRDRDVEDHGQGKGGQHDRAIADRELAKLAEGRPVAHVPGHEQQDGGKARHRNVLRKRCQDQHDGQQRDGVDDAGNRRACAASDVGHGAGNRAGGGDAAKERCHQIGHALGHQFLIRVVAIVDHAVGHPGAQQRFDGTQQGDRDGRPEELLHALPFEGRQREARQTARNATEAAADGVDRQVKKRHRDDADGQHHHCSRHAGGPLAPAGMLGQVGLGPDSDECK